MTVCCIFTKPKTCGRKYADGVADLEIRDIRFRQSRSEERSLTLSPVMKDVPDLRKSGLE